MSRRRSTPVRTSSPVRSVAVQAEVLAEVATPELQKLSQVMVDKIYSFAELGFQEFWTLDFVTGILEREGFTVEQGCAGMPTCYVATWGSGNPVIGFMGDMDGLPETSQKPGVPWQEAMIPQVAWSTAELGDQFDIRAFHSQVLDSGSLPLVLLEEKIDAWIAASAD